MNNPGQAGQAQGQQPGGQSQQNQPRRAGPPLYKPEQMRGLPEAFAAEKEKWEQGLRQLWTTVQGNAPETPQHQDAKRRLFEFSKMLTNKLQTYRMQQPQGAGGVRPQTQGQPSQSQEANGPAQAGLTAEQQQQRQKSQVTTKVMEHVNSFPYVPPSSLTAGTPEYVKWIQEAKQRYLKGLVAMEQATTRLAALEGMFQKRQADGKPLSPEEEKDYKDKKEQLSKAHAEAKTFVDNFRQSQRSLAANSNQQGAGAQQKTVGNTGGIGSNTVAPPPARPQVNPQQAPNPALQNTQTINAAIEVAKNQQFNVPRPSVPQNNSSNQTPQMPSQNAPAQQANLQQPNIKSEAGGT
ncbi:hypothetical protein GLAREA_00482 [Glarea lozoyensis ATCC 20868]|uniref:Uncharacterized protein n=1 Tax=Glarea lozoyensis (strain ATCC 20868 / MF5171) TaxID=1116229 RepID=S3CSD1_GLAL2|nr:uncharacterized protein GLAREA_00482 [Glarea lozoyensis ATCC 20868]EPE29322.1 hypothetical protein GLAREA_00482 [Glarea lozoyensis ATCC 20868]